MSDASFENWVRVNGGDPVKDANKVYLKNLRDAFDAGHAQALEEVAQIAILMVDNELDVYRRQACVDISAEVLTRLRGVMEASNGTD